jgi:hypothetical protein
MSIFIKKPTNGKLIKGRDHKLKYVMTWDDGTHPNLSSDITAIYLTCKSSDALDDEDAVIAINSIDNADQFIIVNASEGQGKIWIKHDDQDDIIAERKYCIDVVVVLTDGTEWPFVNDYNIVFTQPVTQEITNV